VSRRADGAIAWRDSQREWPRWLARASVLGASLWRGVEAQHQVATMKTVDTVAEQQVLEELLEASKPPLAAEAKPLHYLLATPFRYTSPWPSRFRAPHEPGVWYGSHELRTACAEVAWWRCRFVRDSDAFGDRPVVSQHTFFQAHARGRAADLTANPWRRFQAAWMDPADYGACHALAAQARSAGLHWIRYASVRDPAHGACGAVLEPGALTMRDLTLQQGWACLARRDGAIMKPLALGSPASSLEFSFP